MSEAPDWRLRIWNCWTHNYSVRLDGYITHAFEEFLPKPDPRNNGRTLCGVRWAETGLLNLGENIVRGDDQGYWEPGCIKCTRILEKRGWTMLKYKT